MIVQEIHKGLELNGTHQLLLHADDVNTFMGGGEPYSKIKQLSLKRLDGWLV